MNQRLFIITAATAAFAASGALAANLKREAPPLSIAPVVLPSSDGKPREPLPHSTPGQQVAPEAAPAPEAKAVTRPQQPPQTLQEARDRARARLEKLEKMTEAEWEEDQKFKNALRQQWTTMKPDEQVKLITELQKRTRAQRLPDVPPQPAAPESKD